jgi:cytochrome b561
MHWASAALVMFVLGMGMLSLAPPPRASSGSVLLDRLATGVHYGMYVAAFGMAASGIAMAIQADLPAIVFGGSAAPLPDTFAGLAPRAAHGVFARLLLALVALHLAGALYHQLIRRDRPLARMRIGR